MGIKDWPHGLSPRHWPSSKALRTPGIEENIGQLPETWLHMESRLSRGLDQGSWIPLMYLSDVEEK